MRADLLAREIGDIIATLSSRVNPITGKDKPLPDRLLRLAFAKICLAEYKDFGTKHTNPGAFKDVAWWNNLFRKANIGKGSATKLEWQVHHLWENWILKSMGLSSGGKRMDVPGVVMRGYDSGQPGFGPFHKESGIGLASAIRKNLYGKNLSDSQLISGMKDIYTSPPFDSMNLWPAARTWLIRELTSSGRSHLVP